MRLDHLLLSKDSIVLSGVFTKYLHSENHVGQADVRVPFGALAQLGEHLLCKQGVVGSIPSSSTKVLLESTNVSQSARLWFRFDLLAIKAVSFFNNLEEVKIIY